DLMAHRCQGGRKRLRYVRQAPGSRKGRNLGAQVENSHLSSTCRKRIQLISKFLAMVPAMNPDPIQRFGQLYKLAKDAYPEEPQAAVLAAVGQDGRPSARVVLLKAFGVEGFVFYTNLESRKGQELRAHPMAALCFYWPRLHQQVRVEGAVEQVTDAQADAYF